MNDDLVNLGRDGPTTIHITGEGVVKNQIEGLGESKPLLGDIGQEYL